MKKVFILCIVLLVTLLLVSCVNEGRMGTITITDKNTTQEVTFSDDPPGDVVGIYVERKMIGNDVMAFVIRPNNNAIAGYNYLASVAYKGVGRYRAAIKWSEYELDFEQDYILYMPIGKNDWKLYQGKVDKLMELFTVYIEPHPYTNKELQDMRDVGMEIN